MRLGDRNYILEVRSIFMITIRQKGDFSKLDNFFERCKEVIKMSELDKYGRAGVKALASATPRDSGKTAESWRYDIVRKDNSISINFSNSNVTDQGVPIAILLQMGHGTGNGGYVKGIDYINPALRPIFREMADEAWREVTK